MHKRNFFRAVVTALALTMIFASAMTVTAWLKTDSSARLNLEADSTPDISLYVGTYDGAVYQWSKPISVESNHHGGDFGAAFDVSAADLDGQCRFGEINDLTALGNENYIWMCLRIHEDEGLWFRNLRVRYGEKPFLFYGTEWVNGEPRDTPVRMEKADAQIQKHLDRLMLVAPGKDLFISSEEPAQNGLAPQAVDSTRQGYIRQYGAASESADLSGQAQAVDDKGYYYVYFRITPNLDQYSSMVSDILEYMPSYLSFQDLEVLVDVSTVKQ